MLNYPGMLQITKNRRVLGQLFYQCYHVSCKTLSESEVRIPRKKVWSNTAVLEALCDSIPIDTHKNSFYPMTSRDLYPNTPHHANISRQKFARGREAAEYVLNNNPELSNLEWKTDQHHELGGRKPTGLDTPKYDTSVSVLDDLMSRNSFGELCTAYTDLITNGTKIPCELNEKVIAFLAFHLSKDYQDAFFKVLQIINGELTKHSHLALIRGFSQRHLFAKAISAFEIMIIKGHLPDSKTTDILLSCLTLPHGNAELLERFAAAWKHHHVKPTPLTIGVLGFGFHKTGRKSQNQIKMWGRCLREMKHCGVPIDVTIVSSMLKYTTFALKNESIVWAILELSDSIPVQSSRIACKPEGYFDAMVWAHKTSNLRMAKRLYESVLTLERRNFCIHDKYRVFYSRYLVLLSQEDTMKNFIQVAVDLFSGKVFYSPSVNDSLMEACVERGWSQVLPFLYQYLDQSLYRKLHFFSTWLAAARVLIDKADTDTLIQFKKIAKSLLGVLRFDSHSSSADFFLSSLCILIAKSGDRVELVNALKFSRRTYSHIRLDQDAIEICSTALGGDLSALEPYMR